MVPLLRDLRWRGLLPATAGLAAVLCLVPGYAARPDTHEPISYTGGHTHAVINNGTLLMDNPEIRQAPATLIRAIKAEASGLAQGSSDNGRWNLTGKVHIEFNEAVLDSDTAVVVFADGRILSIDVHGKPATFSRPGKTAEQRDQGRAENIAYDANTRDMRFSGPTWYSIGPYEGTADRLMIYNLDTTALDIPKVSDNDPVVNLTYKPPEKKVPAPRTPDRSTAK